MMCTNDRNQLHVVLEQLFYPAILGSAIYAIFERLFSSESSFITIATGILVLALVVLYVADYAYTVVNVVPSKYSVVQFVTDMLIVLCFYLAVKAALGSFIFGASVVFWLFITKLLSVVWEISEVARNNHKWSSMDKYEVGSDAAFMVIYLVIAFWFYGTDRGTEPYYVLVLATFVFLDTATYWLHDWLKVEK